MMHRDLILACVAITLIHLHSVCGLAPIDMPDEKRIIHELLRLYELRGIDGRPVRNSSMPVSLNFSIQLIQIMDLDEKNQILKLSVWDRYLWKDEFLMWDPAQYGGVTNVRIHPDKVWKPDLKLYNYADERVEEHREALLVVEYTGKVVWMPQVIYQSSCAIDISYFPFDEQECKLKFGSWTYDGNKLDVNFLNNLTQIDMSEYMTSNAWEIIKVPGERNVKYYTCCPEPYIDLTFTLRVRRRSAFYNYLLLLPCILLSTLTLVLFWIPPESPAKMALGINIFVAFFLLLVILETSLPSASTVPFLGIYYCFNMVIITLSSFLNVLVVNMAFYGPRGEVPQFLKTLAFSVFAKLFFMNKLALPELTPEEKAKNNTPENPSRATVNGNHFVGVDAETNWLADGWRDCPREHAKVGGGGGGGGGVPIVRSGGGVVIVRDGGSVVGVGVPGSGGPRSGGGGGDPSGGAGGMPASGGRGREGGDGCRGERGGSSSRGGSLERGQRLCSHHRQLSGGEGSGGAVASSGHHHHHHHRHHRHHQHGGSERCSSGGGGGGAYYGSTGEIVGGGEVRGGGGGGGENREVRAEVREVRGGGEVRAEVRGEVRSGGGVRGGGGGSGRESRGSRESRGGRSGTDSAGSGSESLMKRKELIQIERDVKAIRKFVNDSMNRLAESDRREKLSREWKAVALIFDRLFFFFYVIMISISLMVVPVTLRTGLSK